MISVGTLQLAIFYSLGFSSAIFECVVRGDPEPSPKSASLPNSLINIDEG